jgi:PcfJ-like protein
MARSLIQNRQEAERARVEAYEATLKRVTQQARPAPNFERAINEAKKGFESCILREATAWQPHIKTRDAGRLRLAAARYLFARYPVAAHLEQIWLDVNGAGLAANEIAMRRRWYVEVAGGGSLFKAGAAAWLSRKEVHAFLNPLGGNLGFDEAIWQAIARSHTNDLAMVLRIARSSLVRTPRAELSFWREVAAFFCANPTTVEEMDDLRDYLAECFRRNREFSLKGRTLGSLRRQMHAWHLDLEAVARIEAARCRAEAAQARARGVAMPTEASGGGSWPGATIADWSWSPTVQDRAKQRQFVVVQLRTAVDLVAETRAMHHCVASYAAKCIAGHASIWSLRHRVGGQTDRLLTSELDGLGRAIQVRGFANRPAQPEERKVLERWAKARGIHLP